MPLQASPSPYQASNFPPSPGGISSYSYPSPAHPTTVTPTVYYQRSLPSTFPPPSIPASLTPVLSNSNEASPADHSIPWQHHHYISPSSSAAFASQSQDRYVCQTCNKAFSRPSSLRIHSHSHTGEKPFKCPHSGCGKAFSVRSNMKRHERGCHGGGSPGSSWTYRCLVSRVATCVLYRSWCRYSMIMLVQSNTQSASFGVLGGILWGSLPGIWLGDFMRSSVDDCLGCF